MNDPARFTPLAQVTRYEPGAGGDVSYCVEGYGQRWTGTAPPGTSQLELLMRFTVAHAPAGADTVASLLHALLPAAGAGVPGEWGAGRAASPADPAQDVSARRTAERLRAPEAPEAQLSAVVQQLQDAVAIRDLQGRFVLLNPAAERLLGAPAAALIGSQFGELGAAAQLAPARIEERCSVDAQVIDSGRQDVREVSWPDGDQPLTLQVITFPYWVHAVCQGTVCMVRDVSTQRHLEHSLRLNAMQLEERVRARTLSLERLSTRLRHAAVHDALTGLPNRNLFIERLQEVISRRVRYPERRFAVFFLDFDRFKFVNDSLGHAAGDALLLQIAARLKEAAPPATTISRFGGDEFVLLIEHIPDVESARRHAEALVQLFRAPFDVQQHELRLTVSIGVTCCDHPLSGTDEVVQEADLAMYRAKASGRGQYVLFEPHMRERQAQLLQLQSDLGRALRRGELRVYYQPTVRDEQFSGGVEALVRWQHPQYGLIPPNDFILIAEERGLIRELDLWVLRHACQELLQRSGEPLLLGVNFSASHFEHAGLIEQVERILSDTGFPGHRLIFEITERLLLKSNAATLATLERLRARGIQIAIDDFGTGYSALSYLQQLPVDILKIDRSFVNAVTHDPAIVRSITEMAHTLQLRVVAEGVETRQQAEILRELHCDYMQGYLFARPLPFSELQRWIEAGGPY